MVPLQRFCCPPPLSKLLEPSVSVWRAAAAPPFLLFSSIPFLLEAKPTMSAFAHWPHRGCAFWLQVLSSIWMFKFRDAYCCWALATEAALSGDSLALRDIINRGASLDLPLDWGASDTKVRPPAIC